MNVSKNHETKDEYPFLVHKLKYIFDDGLEKDIDCVVSEFFPVNDFTMNDLIYDGTNINHFTFDDILKKETINDILNKKTHMYHGARSRLSNGRFSKFIERGWQINYMKEKESNLLMSKKFSNKLDVFKANNRYITHAMYNHLINMNK